MELDICCFCLSHDRVLKPLGDFSNMYKDFIGRILTLEWEMEINNIPICWECRAHLRKIYTFNRMVVNAYNFLREKHFTLSNLKSNNTLSKLKLTKPQTKPNCCLKEEVNTEENHTVMLKIEPPESTSTDVYSADDIKFEIDIYEEPLDQQANAREDSIQSNNELETPEKPQRLCVQQFDRCIMSEEEMLKTRQGMQENKGYCEKKFKCQGCIKGFLNQSFFNAHIEKFHLKFPGHKICDICSCVVSADGFHQHRLSHYMGYKCDACDYRCYLQRDMSRHYTTLHDRSFDYPCRQCDKVLTSRSTYKYHVRTVHGQKHECGYCGKISSNSTIYKKHLLQHTGMPMHECSVCHKSYKGTDGLARHMTVHDKTPQTDAYCAECDVQYKNIYSYRTHLKTTRRHIVDEPSFMCDYCGKKCHNKTVLRSHILSHDPHRYQCKLCPKKYSKQFKLKQHISIVHDGNPQPRDKVCEICGRGFTLLRILESHKRTHTGERPFQCPFCPNKFGHHAALYRHKQLVHKVAKLKQLPEIKEVSL